MTAAPSTSARSATSLIEPKALMGIRSLELRARAVVEGFWSGLHRSPYHGFSVEFTEYRQYTPGDDLRYLDWRVYARSDRYYIKKFEDETNLRCHLVTDQSQSMAYGSGGHTKAHYAATLAATLAYFLHLQGDAVGLLTFDEAVRDYLPPRHRADHLRQLMLTLEKPAGGRTTDLATPLERMAQLAPYLKVLSVRPPDRPSGSGLSTLDSRLTAARFRWLVEEFRVSLFAQELGTAEPVSAVRLERTTVVELAGVVWSLAWLLRAFEKRFEAVHAEVEEVVVHVAHGHVQLAY